MKLCECGCGVPTRIATVTKIKYGHIKGEPVRFCTGHNNPRKGTANLNNFVVEDRGHTTHCHIWQGFINGDGYGFLRSPNTRKTIFSHKWHYERKHGKVPKGYELDHLCRVPSCCNPEHLEPVSHVVNVRRGLVAKINETQAAEIRKDTRSLRELAKVYGVHYTNISKIRRGKTWKEESQ